MGIRRGRSGGRSAMRLALCSRFGRWWRIRVAESLAGILNSRHLAACMPWAAMGGCLVTSDGGLWEEFAVHARAAGADALRQPTLATAAGQIAEFAEGLPVAATSVVSRAVAGLDIENDVHTSPALDWYGLAAAGIVSAPLLVAETGSTLLLDDSLEDRAVSMLASKLIIVSNVGRLVPTLHEAGEWLDSLPHTPAYAVFMTGPSRTADIERSLSIGVQGPSQILIVAVGNDSDR